jgi:hypothetical protein
MARGYLIRRDALTILVSFLSVAVIVLGYVVFRTRGQAGTASAKVTAVQHQLLTSQKASTETRVTTVGQRCALTQLILGVVVRVHDAADAGPLLASYAICEKQLATVKRINATTPNP